MKNGVIFAMLSSLVFSVMNGLVGVCSAVLAAAAAISIRYLSQKHHTCEIVFCFLAASTLVSIPFMWNDFVRLSWQDGVYLVCIGVVSLLGQLFLTQAFTP